MPPAIYLKGLNASSPLLMRDPTKACCFPAPAAAVEDTGIEQAFVADYRRNMVRKSASMDRLYARQLKERKKMKIGEGKGKWFNRLVESNNMRAQLLLAAT